MLTTFDISPESSDSSPAEDGPEVEDGPEAGTEDRFEDEPAVNDDDFFEDDFGLSAIRREAEALRLQQLKVEEEIAKIQSQEPEPPVVRQIPNKPPPPYVPPARPPRPQPPNTFIPSSVPDLTRIVSDIVRKAYAARGTGEKVRFEPDSVEIPEKLSGNETKALLQYHQMLHDLVLDKVERIYQDEEVEQNPPWMPAKPVHRIKFLVPKTEDALVELVNKQVRLSFPLLLVIFCFCYYCLTVVIVVINVIVV